MDYTDMNVFDESKVVIDLIAETQGEIYALANEKGYDMEDFSNKYLASDFCSMEMDSLYSSYQTEFGSCCMEALLEEFKEKGITIKESAEEIFYNPSFIGELYRHLFYELQTPSKDLATKVPFQELAVLSVETESDNFEDVISRLKGK